MLESHEFEQVRTSLSGQDDGRGDLREFNMACSSQLAGSRYLITSSASGRSVAEFKLGSIPAVTPPALHRRAPVENHQLRLVRCIVRSEAATVRRTSRIFSRPMLTCCTLCLTIPNRANEVSNNLVITVSRLSAGHQIRGRPVGTDRGFVIKLHGVYTATLLQALR